MANRSDEPNFSSLQSCYRDLSDFLRHSSKPALRNSCGAHDITHGLLLDFVKDFSLSIQNHGCLKKPVVAIILPNGPLLAATILAVSTWYTAAPINPAAGFQQVAADLELAGASAIVSCEAEDDRLGLHNANLDVFYISQNEHGVIDTTHTRSGARSPRGTPPSSPIPNYGEDISIVLFTSGTSGTKKIVPMTTQSIVNGVGFVIDSWALTDTDVCLNMMPLYHVGGIIRNIFSPLFVGGSTICCAGFDANLFWDVTEALEPTWYYASPTMHSAILEAAEHRPEALASSNIRLICNAAGGLLPALASQLRDTFHCTVLPSYGMTECMPISTPPIDYKLDRPGTSGISAGPEIAILNSDGGHNPVNMVGRICVRGQPLFSGYLRPDGSMDTSHLTHDGWFDTGDMGYLDADGYLFVTGRNKEVINRGGELISPFEVENALVNAAEEPGSPIYGRVSKALAFSLQHDVLQEVVGAVVVTPSGQRRPDIRNVQDALRTSLQQAKWPVFIVYMDDVPKKNNKVLRIRLAERLGLPSMNDSTPFVQRHWEAQCPPVDTDLSVPISSSVCQLERLSVKQSIESFLGSKVDVHVQENAQLGTLEAILAPSNLASNTQAEASLDVEALGALKEHLENTVDGYMIPQKLMPLPDPLPRTGEGEIDVRLLCEHIAALNEQRHSELSSTTRGIITKIFADLLSLDIDDIHPDEKFTDLGGDSLRAGRLLSLLRSEFQMSLSIELIFNKGTVNLLAFHIDNNAGNDASSKASFEDIAHAASALKPCSSKSPLLMATQLLPLVFIYPMTRGFQWTLFMLALSHSQSLPTTNHILGRLLNLVMSMYLAKLVAKIVCPLVGIAFKWIIIGRHKEGLYPMWGVYHTRWWLTQKIVQICGKGMFRATGSSEKLYYRLLGAKIGRGVTLKNVKLGEWDLLDIGDDVVLEGCTVRPMAGEYNTTMYLGRIKIGNNASVGLGSVVSPGTTIEERVCIGPNSSSWEINDSAGESNRDLLVTKVPKAHWAFSIFCTAPLWLLARGLYLLPWFLGLAGLVHGSSPEPGSSIGTTLDWFAGGERIAFHYLARGLRTTFGPFFVFAFVVLVRMALDVSFGRLRPSRAHNRGNVERWRMDLMKTLMPVPVLHDLTELFGQHYEPTSVAVRLLGGKAGKRIYWPGTGPSIGDYHLIDVGNDVVFGSRSHLVTSDGIGSETIRIEDGAMIADRVVVLPGVVIGKETVMGSGGLTKRGKRYQSASVYVGSRGGDAVCLGQGASKKEATHHRHSRQVSKSSDRSVEFESKGPTLVRTTPGTSTAAGASSETVSHIQEINGDEKHGVCSQTLSQKLEITTKSKSITESIDEVSEKTSTMSPFGRAFYEKRAPYWVFPQWFITSYSTFITVFVHLFWDVAAISAIQIANFFHRTIAKFNRQGEYYKTVNEPFIIFGLFSVFICILATVQALLALAMIVTSKWMLIGRRQPGNYDWDKSSYCQRWQLLLSIEKIRLRCFGGNGILGMLTGTEYLVWYFRLLGAKIGENCALFVNGDLNLVFTEPDLLTLGDRVVVDNASLVGHINSRGKFDLNHLSVGDRCVLRTNSRLLSGAKMEDDSCLMEHTLIMGGDTVDEGHTMQGWPADKFTSRRVTLPESSETRVGGESV